MYNKAPCYPGKHFNIHKNGNESVSTLKDFVL